MTPEEIHDYCRVISRAYRLYGNLWRGSVIFDKSIVAHLPRYHYSQWGAERAASKLADFMRPLLLEGAICPPVEMDIDICGDEMWRDVWRWHHDAHELGKALVRAQSRERQWAYRARKAGTNGHTPFQEFLNKARACGWKCPACGQKVFLTCDHIVPIKKGGANVPSNIQPICGPCNSKKGQRTEVYFS